MTKGVIIYAFKKPSYGKLAFNLAVSIKANSPGVPVCVIHDDVAFAHLSLEQLEYFDIKIPIEHEDLYDGMKFSPGKGKISGYKYFPFDQNMIIDADSLCIRPVEPLFDKYNKKPIYSQCSGIWDETATEWTCQWLPLTLCKEVFEWPKTYNLFEINSSFMLVRKCPESANFYAQAMKNYESGNGHPKLGKWGGTFPDELALNIAFAQTGLQPNFEDLPSKDINNMVQKPMFFSTSGDYKPAKHGEDYYFIGCYGGRNFTSKSLQAQYDRYMFGYAAKFGFIHQWKCHLLMKHKHYHEK